MGVDRNINKAKSLLEKFQNECAQHNYIPTDIEVENKKTLEKVIIDFEQKVEQEREEEIYVYKQKTQQLMNTPITGDFFSVDQNGYCIHTYNYEVCKYCSRRSWNDNRWEDGNCCRIY